MSKPPKVKNLLQQFETTGSVPVSDHNERNTFDFSTTGRIRPKHTVDASGNINDSGVSKPTGSVMLNSELEMRFKTDQNKLKTSPKSSAQNDCDPTQVQMRRPQPVQNLVLRRTALFENVDADKVEQECRTSLSPKSQEMNERGNLTKHRRQLPSQIRASSGDIIDPKASAVSKLGEQIALLRTMPDTSKPTEARYSYENVFPSSSYVNVKEPKQMVTESGSKKPDLGNVKKHGRPPNPSPREKIGRDTDKKMGGHIKLSRDGEQIVSDKKQHPVIRDSETMHSTAPKGNLGDQISPGASVVNKLKMFETSCDSKDEDRVKPHVHILPEHSSSRCRDSSALKDLEKALDKHVSVKKPAKPEKPSKPPRTFQHDEYAKTKAEKLKTPPKLEKSSVVFHKYEDVEKSKRDSESSHEYEEVPEKRDSGSYKGDHSASSKPRRPPPPTLPRRPSLLNRQAVSTLSCESITQALAEEELNVLGVKRMNRNRQESKDVREDWTPRFKPHHETQPKLRRTYSDECIYVDAGKILTYISKDPIYNDPESLDFMSHPPMEPLYGRASRNVQIDRDGYAVPEIHSRGHKAIQRTITNPELGFKQKIAGLKNFFAESNRQQDKKKTAPVKQRINRAFSILRKYVKHDRTGTGESIPEEDSDETDSMSVDSESIVDEVEQKKRLKYVATVREKNYMTIEMAKQNRDKTYPQLFTYALVVGLRPKETDMDSYEPYIMHKFPPQVKDDNAAIPQFCFPDANDWQPVIAYNSETYSFVLTNIDGTRQYGYCLRLLPSGHKPRVPEVYCIISPLDAHGLYIQVLDEIERRRVNVTYDYALEFIAAAYGRPLPSSGKYVHIRTTTPSCQPDVLTLKRNADFRLEDTCASKSITCTHSFKLLAHLFVSPPKKRRYVSNCQVDFDTVISKLGIEATLEVFSSLLLERRVLFTASKLSTLTTCIHAMVALLYPFTWQHTFIPVLPSSLIDIVCSPTPYVIGILSSCQDQLADLPMEEVLIVDIDRGELLQRMGDEDTIIPKKVQKALKMAIRDDGDSEIYNNLVVSEAFMRLFVEAIGHYSNFVCVQQNGEKVFQRESFIKSLRSKSMRMFVEWFCETQMFEVYITDILEDTGQSKELFEARILEYQEEMTGDRFKDNVKVFGKKMKNFGKAIKHKFKDGKNS